VTALKLQTSAWTAFASGSGLRRHCFDSSFDAAHGAYRAVIGTGWTKRDSDGIVPLVRPAKTTLIVLLTGAGASYLLSALAATDLAQNRARHVPCSAWH
jgi:hypothetical protein